jgi:hypothetical protein
MFRDSRSKREERNAMIAPDGTAIGNLRHFVALFVNSRASDFVLLSTSNVYPPGDPGVFTEDSGVTRTGITHGDLRELLALVDAQWSVEKSGSTTRYKMRS